MKWCPTFPLLKFKYRPSGVDAYLVPFLCEEVSSFHVRLCPSSGCFFMIAHRPMKMARRLVFTARRSQYAADSAAAISFFFATTYDPYGRISSHFPFTTPLVTSFPSNSNTSMNTLSLSKRLTGLNQFLT